MVQLDSARYTAYPESIAVGPSSVCFSDFLSCPFFSNGCMRAPIYYYPLCLSGVLATLWNSGTNHVPATL